MAFVHLLCYLIIPYPSKTHCSGDLFVHTAIMQLATYEIGITIEQLSFGQKVGQCTNGEVRRHNGLSAPKRRNEIVVNVNRQLFSSYARRALFIILKLNIASAIRHFRYDIPAIRPL